MPDGSGSSSSRRNNNNNGHRCKMRLSSCSGGGGDGAMAVPSDVTIGDDSDLEDATIDFSNASLYLTGIQTIFGICCCAVVTVLSCWLVPEGGVSAVRTLALCTATGALLMRKPLRVGRARGVKVVFTALQPAVGIYLLALIVEQLVHTCAGSTAQTTSPSRIVFHAMTLTMLVAGFMRARAPLADTDLPFLMTSAALLVIAIVPPPSVAFVGPLCQSVSVWEAAERVVRAFCFAVCYSVLVFSSTGSKNMVFDETIIVVTRSGAASAWIMACHPSLLVLAVLQCAAAIMARLRQENVAQMSPVAGVLAKGGSSSKGVYEAVPNEEDLENGVTEELDVYEIQNRLLSQPSSSQETEQVAVNGIGSAHVLKDLQPPQPPQPPPLEPLPAPPVPAATDEKEPTPMLLGPLKFRQVGGSGELPSTPASEATKLPMTQERMAAIAASLEK
jgi:hypothetical protein